MIKLYATTLLAAFIASCQVPSSSKEDDNGYSEQSKISLPDPEKLGKKEEAAYRSKLEALFDQKLTQQNFNGAILVAKGGHILYEKYVGFFDWFQQSIPITDSSSFHLASTSKPFTAVAVLQQVQQGRIRLEDNFNQYFPQFPYNDVTIKDLLSHRSGLPNYLYFMDDKDKWTTDRVISNQDVLNFLTQHQPALSYKTGTRFNYSNTNYVLLALLLEKVTGLPYPQYLKENIFEPLGMKHTFVYTPADSGKVMMSYKPSGALWPHDIFDNTYGDKNIYSTAKDLFKWDAGLYSERLIRQSLLDSALTPLSNETALMHNYGLGWRILNIPNGKKVIYHNGKWHGFNPAFARLIEEKAVIIILGNRYNNNIYHAAKLAYNIFGNYMQTDTNTPDEDSLQIHSGASNDFKNNTLPYTKNL